MRLHMNWGILLAYVMNIPMSIGAARIGIIRMGALTRFLFPAYSLTDENIGVICEGTPARDGNSIMGWGPLDFWVNTVSMMPVFNHLTEVFTEAIARSRNP